LERGLLWRRNYDFLRGLDGHRIEKDVVAA